MTAKSPLRRKSSEEQLLGEIETQVVGLQYYDATLGFGEQVNLEREPKNPHDEQAIRVENSQFEQVGHLTRGLASWLAPLIDSGKIRVDGCTSQAADDAGGKSSTSRPLTVTVFLCERGKDLLHPKEISDKLDALHDMIRYSYEKAETYSNPDAILELAEGLEPLGQQELLPETRLLLALLPGIAREVRAGHRRGNGLRGVRRIEQRQSLPAKLAKFGIHPAGDRLAGRITRFTSEVLPASGKTARNP